MALFKNTTIFQNSGFKTTKSIAALFSVDIIALIAGILFSIVTARILGESALGAFSFSMAVAILTRIVAEAGYDITIPRTISIQPGESISLFITAQVLKNSLWLVIAPVSFIITAITQDLQTISCTGLMLIWVVAKLYNSTCLALFRGIGHLLRGAKIESCASGITYFFATAAILFFKNLSLAVAVITLGEFLRMTWFKKALSGILRNILPENSPCFPSYFSMWNIRTAFKSNLREQFRLGAINIMSTAQSRMGTFMLGFVGTSASVGEYSAAMRALMAMRILPGSVMNVLLPEFSRLGFKRELSLKMLLKNCSVAAAVGIAISFALMLTAPWLIKWTFGFENAVIILQILAWTFVFVLNNHIFEAYLLSIRCERQVGLALLASTLLIAAGIALCFPQYRTVSAAWATLGGEILLSVYYLVIILLKRKN
ncbi:MAG TPA: oligosaccharide flippase family protein [Patescibacteria group bacterium]|nr:oligosaccharide flippase family protein [Patescibacteria group bacterium]